MRLWNLDVSGLDDEDSVKDGDGDEGRDANAYIKSVFY